MFHQMLKGKGLSIALGAALLASPAAHAVTATTTVQVTFPQVLILYSYDQIALDVTAATLATQLGVSGATCTSGSYCVEFAAPTSTLNWDMTNPVDANIAGGAAALPTLSAVGVSISNAWGVRSVAAGGGLTASVTGPASLVGPLGSSNLPVSLVGTNNTAPTRGMGVLNASRTGSINFTLNANGLDTAGAYSGDFVVEVVSP
jgi:hypothetical protein